MGAWEDLEGDPFFVMSEKRGDMQKFILTLVGPVDLGHPIALFTERQYGQSRVV